MAVIKTKKVKRNQHEVLMQKISELTANVGYWKKQHDRARKREEELKAELKDKNARIRYLEKQLYSKKTEKSKFRTETTNDKPPAKRKKGHQKGTPPPPKRTYDELEMVPEVYDIPEEEKICSICGKPLYEIASTDDSEILEINVKGYKRQIKRKKYAKQCRCISGKKELITAPGPKKLLNRSKILLMKIQAVTGRQFPKWPVNIYSGINRMDQQKTGVCELLF